MEFSVNNPIIFIMVGIIIAVVLAQSVYFFVKAWKRALAIGMEKEKLKKVVVSSAVFTIAPAIAIVVGLIALTKSLGIPLPWLRLSVVGSITYETVAAQNALSAMGGVLGAVTDLTASQFITITLIMTISIMTGIWLVPLISKRLLNGMIKIENKDKKWGELLPNALFIGLISAFLGYIFCDVSDVFNGSTAGLIPVCVMAVSALVMVCAGTIVKKSKISWLSEYALPLSLIVGMLSAIPITAWLG